jgi:hypothetical protein
LAINETKNLKPAQTPIQVSNVERWKLPQPDWVKANGEGFLDAYNRSGAGVI